MTHPRAPSAGFDLLAFRTASVDLDNAFVHGANSRFQGSGCNGQCVIAGGLDGGELRCKIGQNVTANRSEMRITSTVVVAQNAPGGSHLPFE